MARSKYERQAEKELQADGWTVDSKAGMGRFSKNRDFFHRFDLVAVKRGKPLRYISIKGHQGIPVEHLAALKTFWLPKCCVKEVWYWPRTKNPEWNKRIIK